jgi:hypothetical protein
MQDHDEPQTASDFLALSAPLRKLCSAPDRAAFERAYDAALQAARRARELHSLFDLLRFAFPPWRRTFECLRLERALEALGTCQRQ